MQNKTLKTVCEYYVCGYTAMRFVKNDLKDILAALGSETVEINGETVEAVNWIIDFWDRRIRPLKGCEETLAGFIAYDEDWNAEIIRPEEECGGYDEALREAFDPGEDYDEWEGKFLAPKEAMDAADLPEKQFLQLCAGSWDPVTKLIEKIEKEVGCRVAAKQKDGVWKFSVPGAYGQYAGEMFDPRYCGSMLHDEETIKRYRPESEESGDWITIFGLDDNQLHGMHFQLETIDENIDTLMEVINRDASACGAENQKETAIQPDIEGVNLQPWHYRIPMYDLIVYIGNELQTGGAVFVTRAGNTIQKHKEISPKDAIRKALSFTNLTNKALDELDVICESDEHDRSRWLTTI